MTKGRFDSQEAFQSPETVALFGYLVKCNHQMHDFQNKVIQEFLARKEIPYAYVRDVIFCKEQAVPEETALHCLSRESDRIKKEFLFYLYVVSEIDGLTDFEEAAFFQNLEKRIGLPDCDTVRTVAKKKAETERKRLKSRNASKHTGKRANPNSTDNLFRITQREYLAAIEDCRRVARDDFETVKPIVDSVVEKGRAFYSNLDYKLKNSVHFHPEVTEALTTFSKAIEEEIFAQAVDYRREFAKKESAAEDFTISLIGRTKAGKSTLRAVLTGEGRENIGTGAQRTTRINDIYEWNHLRIIDTPGIDAGSDDTREDQAIAEKVIGESDVICYIAASDGLPKNAREFAVNIAKRNKPVIVLLNYKNNIGTESRMQRFLRDPDAWRQNENANSIEGYFGPIKRLAKEEGVEALISYQTVFLFADLLSKDEAFAPYSKTLSEHSGVNAFLAKLKDAVVNKGKLLRSKTIIDDTIVECRTWLQKTDALISPIDGIRVSMEEERSSTEKKLRRAQKRLSESTEHALRDAFNNLATIEANNFAEIHYLDRSKLSAAWNDYCNEIGFSDRIQKIIEDNYGAFAEEIASIMNDVFEDIQFVFSMKPVSGLKTKLSFNVPFRELFRFLGAGTGVAGAIVLIIMESNPIGWALTIGGIVISFIASFFKKKADRQKEAKKKLYGKINSTITEAADKQIPDLLKKIEEYSEAAVKKVLDQYDNLIKGLRFTSDYSEDLISNMELDINELNIKFAQRILEFVYGRHIDVQAVERDFGKTMTVYIGEPLNEPKAALKKVNGLLNERIRIIEPIE